MSILPSQYEGAAKPRQRMAMRSLSPAPPSFARSNSSSSITSPPAPTTLGPEAIFRPGTPFSPSVGNSPLLDGADHQDIDLSPPSPERVPKVIPYVPSKGTRRRSNTLETGGRGGWNGWKERQLKMLAKRGWTTQALAWRFGALFLLGLFFLSGRIKKSWEDHDAAIIQRGQDKFPKLVTPLHKPTAVEEPDEVFLDHEFSPDGFLRSSLSLSQRHPIWEMIDQATEHYNLAVQSQALSLGNFVDHYKKANGRKPPIHFDLLYPHVLKSRPYSPIPSPSSLHMYNSITPYLLHERQLTSEAFYELNPDHEPPTPEEDSGRFVLVIENGEVKTEWPWNPMVDGAELEGDDGGLKDRLQEWMNKPEWQGKIGDLRITVSMDEHNPQLIPFSYIEAAKRRALKNHFEMDQGELRKAEHDWTLGCDPTSALVKKRAGGFGMRMRNRAGAFSPHFVHNPIAATDICQHPALRPLSDVMASYPQPLEVDTRPVPQLAARAGLGKLGADILTLGVGHPSYHAPRVVPWSQKVGTAAFWRGPPPVFHSPLTPHVAHRLSTAFRVALLPTTPIDTHSFPLTLVPPPNVVAREGGGAEQHDGQQVSEGFSYNPEERISMEIWDRKRLLDIAFVTDDEEDKLGCRGMNGCEYLSSRVNYDSSGKNAAHQKYVFVFEGDDPTAAFESGSLVLHSSPLALSAWQTKAIPWHDYIPVSPDFSDLPSILLFLRANDDVAERIATNGQEFGRKVLNKDAGTVAVLGQLLEYARVWSVGRAEMDYAGHH